MPTKGEFWHVGGVQVEAAGLSIFVENIRCTFFLLNARKLVFSHEPRKWSTAVRPSLSMPWGGDGWVYLGVVCVKPGKIMSIS